MNWLANRNAFAAMLCTIMFLVQMTSLALADGEHTEKDKDKQTNLTLKMDRKDLDQLPRNFRISTDEFKTYPKKGVLPSRTGLDTLGNSASSSFSEKEFENVLKKIPAPASKV